MASDKTSKPSEDDKIKEKTEYNPKLDFFSEHFDPLLALRTPNLAVPVANARIYDNLHKYKSVVMDGRVAGKKVNPPEEPKQPIILERKWLPHQLPVQTKRKTNVRNVFTRMENVEGPLQLLRNCKNQRLRIKIWTRHSHDIRGYCIAFVVAFDKHWNLALEDVEEVWTRPKKRKIPALDKIKTDARIIPKVLPPPITIIKSTKKSETCSRHVNQLLLRGEHIAYIVVIPDVTKSTQ